jgi:hypothetical protein
MSLQERVKAKLYELINMPYSPYTGRSSGGVLVEAGAGGVLVGAGRRRRLPISRLALMRRAGVLVGAGRKGKAARKLKRAQAAMIVSAPRRAVAQTRAPPLRRAPAPRPPTMLDEMEGYEAPRRIPPRAPPRAARPEMMPAEEPGFLSRVYSGASNLADKAVSGLGDYAIRKLFGGDQYARMLALRSRRVLGGARVRGEPKTAYGRYLRQYCTPPYSEIKRNRAIQYAQRPGKMPKVGLEDVYGNSPAATKAVVKQAKRDVKSVQQGAKAEVKEMVRQAKKVARSLPPSEKKAVARVVKNDIKTAVKVAKAEQKAIVAEAKAIVALSPADVAEIKSMKPGSLNRQLGAAKRAAATRKKKGKGLSSNVMSLLRRVGAKRFDNSKLATFAGGCCDGGAYAAGLGGAYAAGLRRRGGASAAGLRRVGGAYAAGLGGRRSSASQRRAAASNPWIAHVKQVQAENPELSYKEAMQLASSSYHM